MTNRDAFLAFVSVFVLGACGGSMGQNTAPQLSPEQHEDKIREMFARMEAATISKDLTSFAREWHPEGLGTDLAGEGVSGQNMYGQGSRKGWFLRPTAIVPMAADGPWLVTCLVWSWKKDRAVDEVTALVARYRGRWVTVATVERNLKELRALGRRYTESGLLAR